MTTPRLQDEPESHQAAQCRAACVDNLDDEAGSDIEVEWGADPFSILAQLEEEFGPLNHQ